VELDSGPDPAASTRAQAAALQREFTLIRLLGSTCEDKAMVRLHRRFCNDAKFSTQSVFEMRQSGVSIAFLLFVVWI
jgi:hypothetical protein